MDPSEAHALPDKVLLAALHQAVQQTQQNIDRSRTIVRETNLLLRLAERIQAPLIESR